MKDVIGIGALNLDLMYEVKDLPTLRQEGWPLRAGREISMPPEEFRKLVWRVTQTGTLKFRSGGGSAANTVVALAMMGFQTGFVGRVGTDGEGEFVLREMAGVDLSQVKREGASGVCLVVLDRQRDRALVVQPHANDAVCFEDFDLSYLSTTRYLHMSSFVGDSPLKAQRQLMTVLPPEVLVSLDPGELYARRGLDEILPLIRRASVLLATAHEICALTGRDDYRAGCRDILSLGPVVVVCKMGQEGAYLASGEGVKRFHPEEETEIVDNTGAGDVYNAGFLAGLLHGRAYDDCMAFAHRAAVKSIGGYGRQRYPNAEDLRIFRGG